MSGSPDPITLGKGKTVCLVKDPLGACQMLWVFRRSIEQLSGKVQKHFKDEGRSEQALRKFLKFMGSERYRKASACAFRCVLCAHPYSPGGLLWEPAPAHSQCSVDLRYGPHPTLALSWLSLFYNVCFSPIDVSFSSLPFLKVFIFLSQNYTSIH